MGSPGADQAIGLAAHQFGWRVQTLAAEWRRLGRCAGFIRNWQLLEQALIEAQAHTLPSRNGLSAASWHPTASERIRRADAPSEPAP